MQTNQNRVVVSEGLCSHCFVPAKEVHHSHFPEIRAECGSAAVGAAHLATQLARYREGAQSAWHREGIDLAIADLEAFVSELVEAGEEHATSCQCAVRDRNELTASVPAARSTRSRDDA